MLGDLGFNKEEQEVAVKRITSDKNAWLKFMCQEEIGISPDLIDSPLEIGVVSCVSFVLGAVPAILPFFIFPSVSRALSISALLVLAFLFLVGIIKTRITKAHWLLSGLETLCIGALSCGAGFLLGKIAAGFFH